MLDAILDTNELAAAIREMARTHRIIGPVAMRAPRADPPVRHFYREVATPEQLDLDFAYCVYGPKRFLLPPHETLFTFRRDRASFVATPMIDSTPQALIGVHPCDIHAIRTLDAVFRRDVPDEHYAARRAATFIVGMDCGRECHDGVFCEDMRCNRAESGFDVMLYPLERETPRRRYGVTFGSSAGREWFGGRCRGVRVDDERAMQRFLRDKALAFRRRLRTTVERLPDLLRRSYDSLLWEATARRCYSCGSCNLACPTCYCFNIADQNDLAADSGQRIREWDGCHLREFALVAGGHNFRPKSSSRLRHRMLRKAVWIGERSGAPGCVGCARCDRACTAKINSIDIYNQLAEED
ncbi:MAG: 4Fe-4S dicluster domain-containing protein [Phycisphaerae bacterium]